MGAVMKNRTSSRAKLTVRRESLRQLRTLTAEELGVIDGGQQGSAPPPPRPSYNGC
jgi:hypothetical protein